MTSITSSYSIIYDQMCGTKDVTSGSSEAIHSHDLAASFPLIPYYSLASSWWWFSGKESLGKPQNHNWKRSTTTATSTVRDLLSCRVESLSLSAAKEPFWSYNHRPILAGNCPRFVGGLDKKLREGGTRPIPPQNKTSTKWINSEGMQFFSNCEHFAVFFSFFFFGFLFSFHWKGVFFSNQKNSGEEMISY